MIKRGDARRAARSRRSEDMLFLGCLIVINHVYFASCYESTAQSDNV